MALPSAYLTSFKNVDAILGAIKAAQAPPRFTQKFLESLGFANTNDRLFVNVLKALGFLDDTGLPTRRYHEYLDQTQSERVLADGIRSAYGDLFQININAHDMSTQDVKNKMKTLSEGQYSDRVLTQMAGTFKALCKNADFSGRRETTSPAAASSPAATTRPATQEAVSPDGIEGALENEMPKQLRIGGLVYSINLQLPESRDQAVYDALFKSLKEHLL